MTIEPSTEPNSDVDVGPSADVDAASRFFVEAFADENRRNPYPLYQRMRDLGPIVSTGSNMHLAFGHDACWSMVRNPRGSSDERRGSNHQREALTDPRLAKAMDKRPSLVFLDPPDHTRLRALVAGAFTARRIDALRDDIGTVANRLVGELAADAGEGAPIDVIERFAYPLPITVICRMLGIPTADHDRFRHWSLAITKSVDPGILRSADDEEAIERATAELNEYTAELLRDRRINPADDLLSDLIAQTDGDDHLLDDELIDLVVLLLVAGHETTVNLIGNGLSALFEHRDEMRIWQQHPEIGATAVDELLRYDSPLQMVLRIALDDMRIADTRIEAGDEVILMLGAANRDPELFTEPDGLDLRRHNAGRHIAFGGGIHHCLGASLARAEGAIAIDTLLRRFPDIAPAGPATLRGTFNLRGLEHLPVTLG